MRIAKIPYVSYDRDKKRHFVRLKMPVDVQPILGAKPFLFKFRQSINRETANDLSVDIVRGWKTDIARARMRITSPPSTDIERDPTPRGRYGGASKISYTVRQPGMPLEVTGERARLVSGRHGEELLVQELPVEPRPERAKRVSFPFSDGIDLWESNRHGALPKARQAVEGVMNRLARLLKHSDMGAVTTDDLIRYKTESLLKDKNRRTGKVYESKRNDRGTDLVNEWLHNVVGTGKTFYSHRHTFKTLARWPVMEEETHDAITGHSAGKVGREYGYYPMDKMRGGVEKIANPLAESESDTGNAPAHRR